MSDLEILCPKCHKKHHHKIKKQALERIKNSRQVFVSKIRALEKKKKKMDRQRYFKN
jgi:5-methylcytosine-specific restriction endonuclease McrA